MKPITDDVVFTLLEGMEKRERSRQAALDVARKTLSMKITETMGNRRVISLQMARHRAQRTVSGVMCYVARL